MKRVGSSRCSVPMLTAVAAGMAGAFAEAADGQTLSWLNAAGGSASTAGNWTPAQVPGAASILNFSLAGTYGVSFPASVPASAQINVNAGTVTFTASSPHTASGQFVAGLNGNSTSSVTLGSGTLTAGLVSIASGTSSTSTLTVTGAASDLRSTGALGVQVGNQGNGTLTIRAGGSVRSVGPVGVALGAGSRGTLTVTGTSGATASELVTLDPTNGDVTVGASGPGVLNVTNGGQVTVADDAFIGPTAGFTGAATVGDSAVDLSSMTVAGDLLVGANTTGAAAGQGSLTVSDVGVVSVAGVTVVGDAGGGRGTLTVRAGGELLTRALTIDASNGELQHLGGVIEVDGGVFTPPSGAFTMNGDVGGLPQFRLRSVSAAFAAPSANQPAIIVGTTRSATLQLTTNAEVDVASGGLLVGDAAGSNGTVDMQINARMSFPATEMLRVGRGGAGVVNMSTRSVLRGGSVEVGSEAGGTGLVRVTAGSVFDVAGDVSVGGSASANGGIGSLTVGGGIQSGSRMNITGGVIVWDAADSLTVAAGGTLTAAGPVAIGGRLSMSTTAVLDAAAVTLTSPVTHSLTGAIRGPLNVGALSSVVLVGNLSLGESSSTGQGGLTNLGGIDVGNSTLTVGSTGGGNDLNNCHVGPLGRVVCGTELDVNAGAVLSGDGVIDAPIRNDGQVTAEGNGLVFERMVTGVGAGIGGTRVEFGEGFTGTGSFSGGTVVLARAGSVIRATGLLTMGNASVPDGFVSDGRIEVSGSDSVRLGSSTAARVHDVTFVNGDPIDTAEVVCSTGLGVTGRVSGVGEVGGSAAGAMRLEGGVLDPGAAGAPGRLLIHGDLVLATGSRCEVDIFGPEAHDEIRTLTQLASDPVRTIPGDVTLGGTLVVRVAAGHAPAAGEKHLVLSTEQGLPGPDGRVSGDFAAVEAPRHWHVRILRTETPTEENGVYVVYCNADFNEDGFLDFFDYIDFVTCFETGACSPGSDADFNQDGFADFFDYDEFVRAFESGC